VTDWLLDSTFRGCAFVNTVAEVGPSLPDVLGIATQHKHKTAQTILPLLADRANAKEIAWAATLAIDGAVVNAQRGKGSASTALTGLRLILSAITKEFPVGRKQ
jgi:hypothetical protein